MTNIDTQRLAVDREYWDECGAPEDATHFEPESERRAASFMKVSGGIVYFLGEQSGRWVKDRVGPLKLIPRPPKKAQEGGRPEPGTEALATWLEAPDGGDRRPERVLIKGYYGLTYRGDPDDGEQVWFTTQEGEDLVHLTENVLFEPLPSEHEELYEDLVGALPFVEHDEKLIREMAQILYAQGYRKPERDPRP